MMSSIKLKILVCDDEPKYLPEIRLCVARYMNAHHIVAEFFETTRPQDVFDGDLSFDLAFLDVQMGEIDGITVAKELRRRNERVVIFFVTAFAEYQDDAMDMQAFRFFEKPVNALRLEAGLNKALAYIDRFYVDVYFQSGNMSKRVLLDDIILIKIDNRNTRLITKHGEYVTRESLDEWQEKLNTTFFFRIHKSFLINIHYVTEYSYRELLLSNGMRLSIPSRKQAEFHKYWFSYLKGR